MKRHGMWKGDVFGGMVQCDDCARRVAADEEREAINKMVVATGVPREFRDAAWDGFDCRGRGGALGKTVAELEGWVQSARDEWLYLYGPVGSGKTRAASTLVMDWLRHRSTHARFRTAATVLGELREAEFGSGSGSVEIVEVAGWHLLVVDDLGAEKATDYRTEKLIELFTARWEHDPPHRTVITSNLNLEQLSERLGSMGLSSRLAQWCRLVKMDVPDYRVQIARSRRRQRDG